MTLNRIKAVTKDQNQQNKRSIIYLFNSLIR